MNLNRATPVFAKSSPIDIPNTKFRRIPRPPKHKKIVIEITSPISNYGTMYSIIKDAMPHISSSDIQILIIKLNRFKTTSIPCNTDCEEALRKLIENGLCAWIES